MGKIHLILKSKDRSASGAKSNGMKTGYRDVKDRQDLRRAMGYLPFCRQSFIPSDEQVYYFSHARGTEEV
jgi:hypothetical protein